MGILYIVATPIGNLADITYRAVDVLREADIIACEDTRRSGRLLGHYGLKKRLVSLRAENQELGAGRIVSLLDAGSRVAYMTDAGTPGLSDPGAALVSVVRSAGHEVVPIPGPSALTTLLSVSGFSGKTVVFEGFLSPKPGKRRRRLEELLEEDELFVVYESPHRIGKLLADLKELAPERKALLGREMTKLHEEYMEGSCAALYDRVTENMTQKGEFTLLVAGSKNS
jgi:16S rRNA (cytidine1402-2'-O)-methyltransferase